MYYFWPLSPLRSNFHDRIARQSSNEPAVCYQITLDVYNHVVDSQRPRREWKVVIFNETVDSIEPRMSLRVSIPVTVVAPRRFAYDSGAGELPFHRASTISLFSRTEVARYQM